MNKLEQLTYGTKKHYKKLNKICEPFHRLFGSNHVGFLRINNDHSVINLHTNAAWLDRCMEQKYFLQDPTMVHPDNITGGSAFYFTYKEDEFTSGILKDSVENFDMAHELVFINKNPAGFDVVAITAPQANNAIYNKLLKYPEHTNKFLAFFRRHVITLSDTLDDYKVNLAELKGDKYHLQKALITTDDHNQYHADALHNHCQQQFDLTQT